MVWTILTFLVSCMGTTDSVNDVPQTPPVERPMPMPEAERHTRNLRFRDNRVVFNDSARWLDAHREESLPVMFARLADQGPDAIGIAIVLGVMALVPHLEAQEPNRFYARRAFDVLGCESL